MQAEAEHENSSPVSDSKGDNDQSIHKKEVSDDNDQSIHKKEVSDSSEAEVPPDLPPDSFWVAREDEMDWLDRNGFMERKDSIKFVLAGNPYQNHQTKHSSQDSMPSLNQKSKLPGFGRNQKSPFFGGESFRRRSSRQDKLKLFRSRSEPVGKMEVQASEPGSPRVSCMGKVRSKKVPKKPSFWTTVKAVFRGSTNTNRATSKEKRRTG